MNVDQYDPATLGGKALTPSELRVVLRVASGDTNADAGHHLHLAENTIKAHVRRARIKLGARDRAHLVALAIRDRLIGFDAAGQIIDTATTSAASSGLGPRELDVLSGMAGGMANTAIATQLGIAEDTVKTYAKRMFMKLGVHDRAQAVAVGFERGYLSVPGEGRVAA